MHSPSIQRLRIEWQITGTSPASRTACHRLAAHEPVVANLGVNNLAELVAAIAMPSTWLSPIEAANIIAAMLRSADVDPLIARAIIQALIPGVLALPRRFDRANGPWCDLDAFLVDAISNLWEQIIKFYDTVFEQDNVFTDTIWGGMKSPAFEGAFLGYPESRIYHWHQAFDEFVGRQNIPEDMRVAPVIGPEWIYPRDTETRSQLFTASR